MEDSLVAPWNKTRQAGRNVLLVVGEVLLEAGDQLSTHANDEVGHDVNFLQSLFSEIQDGQNGWGSLGSNWEQDWITLDGSRPLTVILLF